MGMRVMSVEELHAEFLASEQSDPKNDTYVIIADIGEVDGCWITPVMAEELEALLAAQGWDVTVRSSRAGEAQGTYMRRDEGTLQILGYSLSIPTDLSEAIGEALDHLLRGGTLDAKNVE